MPNIEYYDIQYASEWTIYGGQCSYFDKPKRNGFDHKNNRWSGHHVNNSVGRPEQSIIFDQSTSLIQ